MMQILKEKMEMALLRLLRMTNYLKFSGMIGSHVSKKQLIHLGIAKAKDEAKKDGVDEIENKIKTCVHEAGHIELQIFIVPCCNIYVYCL